MSLTQALIASDLNVTNREVGRAFENQSRHAALLRSPLAMNHTDTPHRRKMRALLDGAALADCIVKLAFIKQDGSLRYMLCLPCAGADATARYVTVQDLEQASDRPIYRRVNLDTIAALQVDYSIIPA